MAEQREGDLEVGARVRVRETGRTGTIREALEARGRTLYYVVYDRTSPAGTAAGVGDPVAEAEFGVYTAADALDALP
jgi:hypothetical protein